MKARFTPSFSRLRRRNAIDLMATVLMCIFQPRVSTLQRFRPPRILFTRGDHYKIGGWYLYRRCIFKNLGTKFRHVSTHFFVIKIAFFYQSNCDESFELKCVIMILKPYMCFLKMEKQCPTSVFRKIHPF